MLLLSSEDVHTRNNRAFPHRRSSSVAVYLTGHLVAAILEKKKQQTLDIFPQHVTNNGVVLPHGNCKINGGQGGLIFEGKCIIYIQK